jgi:hypothetical protein
MNPSNPLQSEEPGIGNDSVYAASAVSPNANPQDKTSSLFTIDHVAKPLPNAAQTLEDPHFDELGSQQPFFDCITQVWHQHIRLYARQLEGYRMKLIILLLWQQINILRKNMRQVNFPLNLKAKMMMGPRGASNCYIFNRRPAERCSGQIWHGAVKQKDTYSYIISTGTRKLELTTL